MRHVWVIEVHEKKGRSWYRSEVCFTKKLAEENMKLDREFYGKELMQRLVKYVPEEKQ
jgi:hypothetical protein